MVGCTRALLLVSAVLIVPLTASAGGRPERDGDRQHGGRPTWRHDYGREHGYRKHIRGPSPTSAASIASTLAPAYRLRAELPGFRAVTRDGLQLLVGEIVTVNLPMLEATAAETITVSATASLVDVSTSSLGGNVNPTQVQELPVAGRNWMGLSCWRQEAARPRPTPRRRCRIGTAARRVSSSSTSTDSKSRRARRRQSAAYSQDSIAEFQFISNRFDATQGRSSGAGERDHQVGHQPPLRCLPIQLP